MKIVFVLLSLMFSVQAMAIGQVVICGSEQDSIRATLIGGIFNSEGKYPVGGHVLLPSGEKLYFSEIQIVESNEDQSIRMQILDPQNSGIDLVYNFETKRLSGISIETKEEIAQTVCLRMNLSR